MLIFDVPRPSKIVPKSMPKRLQNQLYVGYPLGNLKNTIFDVKTSPRWTTKIPVFFFFKNRPKILAITVFGPRCLLEASKSIPRASREPPKSRSRALKRHPRAFKKPPCSLQEGFQREGCLMSLSLLLELLTSSGMPTSLQFELLISNAKTATTKEQCRHGGGPTRQRSWI